MSLLTEDRQLLSRFRAGERQSMELVFRHYAPQLSALVARGLSTRGGRIRPSSPFEVGAVVQEAFARAFTEKARGAYDGASDYLQYLAAIARNELLNQQRGREDLTEQDVLESQLGGASPNSGAAVGAAPASPEQATEERELHGLVSNFLAARDAREQEVYRARFEQHLTQEDAAAVLGLTRIQVRRLEAKLRRDLFAHLRSSGYLDRARPVESSLVSSVPEGAGAK
ncbi:MAG: sigma-70 family RNA polymerase sigma factor [Myxococcaceae bacterium]|nr:sigma-70 family RNA polymerase sigma factor [Myxococcaceae bacterium]